MTFAAPALLLGLAAAALPLLVHWFLRPRPKRIHFPAVRLMREALASGRRAQRIRDHWLLLARCALLGAAAFALAGPRCAPAESPLVINQPVAAAVVFDDSCSVRYRMESASTLLDRLRAQALDAVREARGWPQPSVVGLWAANPAVPPHELSGDIAAVGTQIEMLTLAQPLHAATLNSALRAAADRLAAAHQPIRRLMIFTDLAAHAWRDVPPGLLAAIDGLRVHIISPDHERRTNLDVRAVQSPRRIHPESMPLSLQVSIGAAGVESTCFVSVREADRTLARLGPLRISADSVGEWTIGLPPLPAGPHGLTVSLEPTDRLDFDQSRYVAVQTGRRPVAWHVCADQQAVENDLSAVLFANLIAPEALDDRWQAVTYRRLAVDGIAAAFSAAAPADAPDLIIVPAGVRMGDDARSAITRRVEAGASLFLACSSADGAVDWPGLRTWISRSPPKVDRPAASVAIALEKSSALTGDGFLELSRAGVRRRLLVSDLADGVSVHANFSDQSPALVSARVGRGSVFLLATSPDPAWSDLGTRAAGLLTLLHELLQRAQPPAEQIAAFSVGESSNVPLGLIAGDALLVDPPGGGDAVRVNRGSPTGVWPTASAGIGVVRGAGSEAVAAIYSVNWPAEESDFTPIDAERLAALLGTSLIEFNQASTDVRESIGLAQRLGIRDPADAILILLLGLLIAETLLSARKKPRVGYATDAGS